MISIREWFELTFGNMMTSARGKRILQSVLLSAQSSLAPLNVLEETPLVQVNFGPL